MNEHNGKSKLELEKIEGNMMTIFDNYNGTTAKHIIYLQFIIIFLMVAFILCVLFFDLEKGLKSTTDTLIVYTGYLFAFILLLISFKLPKKISDHKVIGHFVPLCWLFGLFIPSGILLSSIASQYGSGGNAGLINYFSFFLGAIGVFASIAAIYHSYSSEKRLEEKLDLRILNLNQKDCFSKLAFMLNGGDQKSCNELGRPPREHISIVNRNSLIPGFWVDPLCFHNTEWKALIKAIYKSIADKKKEIDLELYVPVPRSFKADDLSLMLLQNTEQIPGDGKNLVIITNKDNSLHFRIFDNNGNKVVDKQESELSDKSDVDVIGNLKKQLNSLWDNREIKRDEELQIIDYVTSITCYTYFNNYFSVITTLAKKNANKIIDRAFGESTIKKNEFRNNFIKGKIYLCVKKLPNCLNDQIVTNVKFPNAKHGLCSDTDNKDCNDSCNYYKHCKDEDNLTNCLIMQYCECVEHLFIQLESYASKLSFTDNPVDEKINFPLLIFFDSKTLLSENDRSKVAMIMMHKNVIEDGKFNSHILFPWAIVNGLKDSIDHTNEDHDPKDSANICSNIVRAHKEHRYEIMKELTTNLRRNNL